MDDFNDQAGTKEPFKRPDQFDKTTLNGRFRANGNLDWIEFVTLFGKVLTAVRPDIMFSSEHPRDLKEITGREIDTPIVTYRLKRKTISGREQKQRPRMLDSQPVRSTMIWGQKFDITAQFDCWERFNYKAEELVDVVEGIMRDYLWLFKKQGLVDAFYLERFQDRTIESWKEKVVNRSVQYHVIIEHLQPEPIVNIKDIKIQSVTDVNDRGDQYPPIIVWNDQDPFYDWLLRILKNQQQS